MAYFRQHADLAIPLGSIVLVTGINGMIGIHVADELLKAGFRVRGTVRSPQKANDVVNILARGPELLDMQIVEDMVVDGAYDHVAQGVAAIIHVASVTHYSEHVDRVISPTTKGVMNVLHAASKNESVKRVVITSSIVAASGPRPGTKVIIDENTWNDAAVDSVYARKDLNDDQVGLVFKIQVYAAAKVESQRAAWAYAKEHPDDFVLNYVHPAMNWGKVIGPTGPSGKQLPNILLGSIPAIPSVWMIDTVDDARIHVAAAVDSTVANRRIFAVDEPTDWEETLTFMREILPERNLPSPRVDGITQKSNIDNAIGRELLRKWWAQPGYKGLKQTIYEQLEMFEANPY